MERIDLGILAEAMHSRDAEAYVDPASQKVHIGYGGELFDDDGEHMDEAPDDWVPVPTVDSSDAYRDMDDFARAVGDSAARDRLLRALDRPGPFRAFRDAMYDADQQIRDAWGRYRDACEELRAAEWLGAEGILPESELVAVTEERRREADVALRTVHASSPLDAVESLERELQTPQCRSDPARLRELLATDFEEIGASGRVWDAAAIVELLASGADDVSPIAMEDLRARQVSDGVVLIRWTSSRAGRRALRTSLWRKANGAWELFHHQATPLT